MGPASWDRQAAEGRMNFIPTQSTSRHCIRITLICIATSDSAPIVQPQASVTIRTII